ncbi:hypothetical protein BS78_05G198000 [Paspalum vaginatum]|nr:hypothetical protein BS78_05G198000 [Paspalum vaginatum]
MAGLAVGAVNSLLGLIRNEALLLSRVRGDVRFIKEEMESMNSFLAHLARTTPPGGEHDEQVLTWMKQVEELAHDCRDSVIVLYIHRGDPEVHRAMGRIQSYVRWFPWFVRKIVDQHRAANRLRELKERARDVSERRKRYDVEVRTTKPWSSSSQAEHASGGAGALGMGYDEDDGDSNEALTTAAAAADGCRRRRLVEAAYSVPVVDYCRKKLADWAKTNMEKALLPIASIAVVAQEEEEEDNISGTTIAQEAVHLMSSDLDRIFWIEINKIQGYEMGSRPTGVAGLPMDVLSYILLEMGSKVKRPSRMDIFDKQEKIWSIIKDDTDSKIKEIVSNIEEVERRITSQDSEGKWLLALVETKTIPPDELPLCVLLLALSLTEGERVPLHRMGGIKEIKEMMAQMLQRRMQSSHDSRSSLHVTQCECVLQRVFPAIDARPRKQQEQCNPPHPTVPAQDNLNDLIHNHKITLEIIRELLAKPKVPEAAGSDDSAVKEEPNNPWEATSSGGITSDAVTAAIKETKLKVHHITELIQEQRMIAQLVHRISMDLAVDYEKTLIILQDERDRISRWEDTINALSLLARSCRWSVTAMVITPNNQRAKEYCNPEGEPIACSLAGVYHDIVLQLLTSQLKSGGDKYSNHSKIFRDILDKCGPDEFCMKMFAHALCAKPNMSYNDLCRLHEALDFSNDSSSPSTTSSNFRKLFKFSYNDLPKDYKSCLLYLAIFPKGAVIKRSILVGRWVTEGLIAKEDWPSSVQHAETCFDTLINRFLVYAADIGAAGNVKSCVVGDLVHGVISKIAKKERIVDPRLSLHLAHHFSVFSDLQLHRADSICMFVRNLQNFSPQLLLIKLLDLQDCQCFDKKNYLKAICNKIPFLKYLSLRGTNVTNLPGEINNLHDLEILDIRQTMVPENATKHILLLKLRRLLAGGTDPSPSSISTGPTNNRQKFIRPSVCIIPEKIEKMENMEVLSNVMPSMHGNDNGLKNISKLWQLRKLGVVIRNNDTHIKDLLQAIDDLKESLQSVSITIRPETKSRHSFTSEPTQLPNDLYNRLVNTPKHLESVSIQGYTGTSIRLLSLLGKGSNELDKVALSGTRVQDERFLKVIADLPKICCVRLGHDAYKAINLTFDKDEFEHLKCLLVEGDNMKEIDFKDGAAVELEKIVLSYTNLRSLCGVGYLPKLKELVLKGNKLLFDSSSEGGGAPQQTNQAVSLTQDGAAPQKNTVLVSHSEDGTAPQKSTQLVSPSEDGGAPQKNNLAASTSEGGAAPQKNTILVSPSEVGAAPKKITEQLALPSEDGASPGKTSQLVSSTQDGEAPQKKTERKIIFKKEEFQHLKYFTFEDSEMIKIIIEDGAVPELEKIVLSLCSKQSQLSVVGILPKLKEVELKGDKSILHSLFNDVNKIGKVILCRTSLKQGDLEFLAKKPYICCLVLLENSYDDTQLTFNKDDFPKLNLLHVNCFKIKTISFQDGCAPNLEKIVLSFVALESLSGIDKLQKLEELELNGDTVPKHLLRQVNNDITEHKNNPALVITSKKLQHPHQEKELEKEEGEGSWFGC